MNERPQPTRRLSGFASSCAITALLGVAGVATPASTIGAPIPNPLVATGVDALARSGDWDRGSPLDSNWVADQLRRHGVPGVSIAVVDGGEVVWARGFGVVATGSGEAVDTSTLFQAASISKPVAAVGALLLVQHGEIGLDEDVSPRLHSWSLPETKSTEHEKVTLRRLLSHSAGTTVHGFRGYAADEAVPSLIEVLDGVPPANSPPVRVELVPGTTWRYSGGGTSIVQQLIVDVSGDRFPDHMRRNVLEALAMTNSTFEQPIEGLLAERTASGHDATGAVLHGRWHTYPEMAAAGLWTTPSDLARLIVGVQRSFRGDRTGLISVDLAREMLTVQHGSHGLGFEIARCGDATCYSHAGANAGFRAFLIGVAETGQGAVVMTNGDAGIPVALAIVRRLAETYGWPGSSR